MSSNELVDVDHVLSALASRRRIFHSEADFQFAFAWTTKEIDPLLEVRMETHPEPNVRLDVLLERPDLERRAAIELKYMTRLWSGTVDGETFSVKNHGAHDVRCYDVVKDVERVERFIDNRAGWEGYVIALSNDSSYWRPANHSRPTNADAFRICEGVTLEGTRGWGPKTGAGTSRGREAAITLRQSYPIRWHDYARVDRSSAGMLRALVIHIAGAAS